MQGLLISRVTARLKMQLEGPPSADSQPLHKSEIGSAFAEFQFLIVVRETKGAEADRTLFYLAFVPGN